MQKGTLLGRSPQSRGCPGIPTGLPEIWRAHSSVMQALLCRMSALHPVSAEQLDVIDRAVCSRI